MRLPLISLLFLISTFSLNVQSNADAEGSHIEERSPFTPKASLIRYWNKQISEKLPKCPLLLNRASPLTAVQTVTFSKLAATNALKNQLPAFCSAAKLFCYPDLAPSLEKHDQDSNFESYLNKNFTNYGTSRAGGLDSFKNYSDGDNLPIDSFRRYSRDAAGHTDKFANYAPNTNVPDQSFKSYAAGAAGGSGEFKNYQHDINVPNLHFTSYSDDAVGRSHDFTSYSEGANAGDQGFTSYGKKGTGTPNGFSGYGSESNVVGSTFTNYAEGATGNNDTFKTYGFDGNVPVNNFIYYADGGNSGSETFSSYRDQSNVGDDSFKSYAKNSNAEKVNFNNYGKSFNEGTDKFSGYGKGADGQQIGFKIYGVNNTFSDYANKKSISFAKYSNVSSSSVSTMTASEKKVNRWVEPGKFFRESELKKGNVMPMPDIVDKMPTRSFLPRSIVSKLPFSSSNIGRLKEIFHAQENSTMERVITDALSECERAPSAGETKQCVGSVEDMIDFATSVLGRNVVARTTENTKGSKKNIMIGEVKGINGGKVTKSVSCHQSLYPYLLYYCHSVPKVRVYEADILDSESKAKINHGVAICHLDTSEWSPGHGAFLALGSAPGKIEVCHWIFENDLTWTVADN